MKAPKIAVLAILILFCSAAYFVYPRYVSSRDERRIAEIIQGDGRLSRLQATRMGNAVYLDGELASKEELSGFLARVNQVKRGRVVCRITTQDTKNAK